MTEWILSSSILILVVIALRTCFKGKISLRLQYAIWGLVLLRLLIPVNFGSTNISVANLTISNEPPAMQSTITPNTQNTQHVPNPSLDDIEDEIKDRYESQGIDVEVHVDGPMNVNAVLEDMLPVIWAVGFVSVAGLFLFTNARFKRKIMDSRYGLGLRKNNLDVYATGEIDTPCLFGIKNPAIYVTYPVADNPTLLRHTLEHEATHYRHGDHIWAVLRCVCLAIHWYNPLVWWAAFLSQRDAELACDEATIKRLGEGERAEYGRTLIGMTCQKKANVLITATTMNSGKGGLKERIMLIAKKPKMALYTLLIVVLVAAIAVGCTFTGAKDDETASVTNLEEFFEEYRREQAWSNNTIENMHYIGSAENYALVYDSGMGGCLVLYRYELTGNQIQVLDYADGEYTISGGLSVNHLVDGDKHIYYGTVSDYHWMPASDTRIPINWKSLFITDESGREYEIEMTGKEGYLCVLDAPMENFIVIAHDDNTGIGLTMTSYLNQGYYIHESMWFSQWGTTESTSPVENTEPTTPTTEIPDDAPPVNIPEMLHEQPDPDKICIAVMPTMLSSSGEDWYYIIPENQELLMNYYQTAAAKATKLSWDNNVKQLGWKICYQDEWWIVKEDGSVVCDLYGDRSIASADAKELYEFCEALVKEAGIGDPVRPEDITGIISATLYWNAGNTVTDPNLLKRAITVTDPFILERIETLFSNSREYGSVQCWMGAHLELKLENGETKVIAMATDSCASWMSEGCCYSYGEVTNVGIEGNEEFYSFFLTEIIHKKAQEGPEAVAEYWPYTNWRMYSNSHTIDETFALIDMFKAYAVANPTDWIVTTALTTCRGLDGAFAQYYGGVVAALFEADPAIFSFACNQMIPEQDVENAVNLLAFYWNITPEEVREKMETAQNQN